MKVYMFFTNDDEVINKTLHLSLFPNVITEVINGTEYTLYAWTTKKKYKKAFYKLRKKEFFHLIIEEMTKEEFVDFYKCGASSLELCEYEYMNMRKKINLITTAYEFDVSRHLWIDVFSENTDKIFGYIPYNVTQTLQDEYQEALFKLGVNAMLIVADDEFSDFMDKLDFSIDDDYVLNIPNIPGSDRLLGRKVTIPVSICGKTLNSFIHIFKSILRI